MATAELQNPTQTAIFMAKRSDLVLVRRPERKKYDANQEPYMEPGDRLEFREGRFQTDDPEVIAWLREHARFGDATEGFFEIEPPVPAPDQVLQHIAMLGIQRDVDGIAEVLAAEVDGYQRELVIQTATTALEQLAAIEPPAGA